MGLVVVEVVLAHDGEVGGRLVGELEQLEKGKGKGKGIGWGLLG